MAKRILVPLDGSKSAETVLPYATALAKRLSHGVDFLAVIDVVELARSVSAAESLLFNHLVEEEERRCNAYLDAIAKGFADVPARCLVMQGHAADAIVETAAGEPESLIAMATHGRSGIDRFLLGSVAEKVLRASTNPLLLVRANDSVRAEDPTKLKSIVVPLDGSDLAESVLSFVADLAQKLQLEVVLFRAYAVPYGAYTAGEGFYDPVNLDSFLARLREESENYLERKAAELKRRGLPHVSWVCKEGLGADEIIKFTRATPANLIAMCSHGYSGVKRWVLGSVAETVVRHSNVPVLVLRSPL